MREIKWKRLAGLCAVLALALHGASALGQPLDPGLKQHFALVALCQPELVGALAPLAASGWLREASAPPISAAPLPGLQPSRGPPA